MLTKRQLQRIAQRHGIGLQAQERDYIQFNVIKTYPKSLEEGTASNDVKTNSYLLGEGYLPFEAELL